MQGRIDRSVFSCTMPKSASVQTSTTCNPSFHSGCRSDTYRHSKDAAQTNRLFYYYHWARIPITSLRQTQSGANGAQTRYPAPGPSVLPLVTPSSTPPRTIAHVLSFTSLVSSPRCPIDTIIVPRNSTHLLPLYGSRVLTHGLS
jgi:hypothetical protein